MALVRTKSMNARKSLAMGTLFWAPHPKEVWAPCERIKTDDKIAKFMDEGGEVFDVPIEQANGLWKVSQIQLEGIDDVCDFEEVNEGALLHNIRLRFESDKIYTRVARLIVAVNPFKALPIYTSSVLEKFAKARDSMDLEPHVYGIGLDAVSGLWDPRKANQAVLISGESGAGKTESAKLIGRYVAEALSGDSTRSAELQEMIMQTAPILEAFGNAMTVRNNNSSRFGKWTELKVDRATMSVNGCDIIDYLLELSRVCKPGSKERGFHVFFQLLTARNDAKLSALGIMGPEKYTYIKNCCHKAPGVDDTREFRDVKEAFEVLHISDEVQEEIFRTVIGILTIGNCDFVDGSDESVKSVDDTAFDQVSSLLKVPVDGLKRLIMKRYITVGKEELEAQCNATQAKAGRDGFAMLLYGRLFKWVLKALVDALKREGGAGDVDQQFFGVLDIAGFESFEFNSLEQFFINLSNEELQNYFNDHTFKAELNDCEEEGILQEAKMSFSDNIAIVELMSGKGGLLAMLDEELMLAKATDQTYYNKIIKAHAKHARFIAPRITSGTSNFGIRHFAGDVTYSAEGFLDKNRDPPPKDAPNLLQSSDLWVLKQLGKQLAKELDEEKANAGSQKKKTKTISAKFRDSLQALMTKLRSAEPHFIRCIKPNFEKVPGKISSKMIMEQLAAAGVLETVRIKQEGFSRMKIPTFKGRYRLLASKPEQKRIFGKGGPKSEKEQVQALVEALTISLTKINFGFSTKDIILGCSKVFMKRKATNNLERALDSLVIGHVVNIQRVGRGIAVRRKLAYAKEGLKLLTAFLDKNDFYAKPGEIAIKVLKSTDAIREQVQKAEEAAKKSELLPKSLAQPARVKKIAIRMAKEAKLLDQMYVKWPVLKGLVDPVEIQKLLALAEELEIPNLEPLRKRLGNIKKQLPLLHSMEVGLKAKTIPEVQEVHNTILALKMTKEDWIPELAGYEKAAQIMDLLGEMKSERRLRKAQNKLLKVKQEMKANPEDDVEADAKAEDDVENEFGLDLLEDAKKALDTQNIFSYKLNDSRISSMESSDDSEDDSTVQKVRSGGKGKGKGKFLKRSLTGFTPAQCDDTLEILEKAAERCDVLAMEKIFSVAVVQNLSGTDLEAAEQKFKSLHKSAFVCNLINEMSVKAKAKDPAIATPQVLQTLKNLLKQAKFLEIPKESYNGGDESLQKGVRDHATDISLTSISEETSVSPSSSLKSPEIPELTEEAFSDLYKFPGLKDPSKWKGHAKKYASPAGFDEKMLSHSRNKIKEALTGVHKRHEDDAKCMFCDVLGWMMDLSTPESQRLGLAQSILVVAKASVNLGDELYVQVMKQLTKNPSKRSEMLGWQLLHLICQKVVASEELREFVRTFLVKAIAALADDSNKREVVAVAKQCFKDMHLSNRSRFVVGTVELVPVQVMLIDSSTRKVHVPRSATLVDLADAMNEQLQVLDDRLQDFSFFHLVDERLDGRHRLLPQNSIVRGLRTGADAPCALLYKRRFLTPDENLLHHDVAHANLTYAQAFFEYINYPVNENADFMCHIAASILGMEADHYANTSKHQLRKHDRLEQLLPKCMVPEAQRRKQDKVMKWIGMKSADNKVRSKYAKQLSDAHANLKKTHDPTEPRLVQMSKVLNLLQELSFLGATCWETCPLSKLSPDRVPLPEVVASGIETGGVVFLMCIDVWGLRFLPVGEKHKEWAKPQLMYLFVKGAENQVVQWCAKGNIVQFIMKQAAMGGAMSTMFVESREAKDIALRMDVCFKDGAALQKERRAKMPARRKSVKDTANAAFAMEEDEAMAQAEPDDDAAQKLDIEPSQGLMAWNQIKKAKKSVVFDLTESQTVRDELQNPEPVDPAPETSPAPAPALAPVAEELTMKVANQSDSPEAVLNQWRRKSIAGTSVSIETAVVSCEVEELAKKEEVKPLKEREVPARDYEKPSGRLVELLKLGAIRLVRGDWLVELAAKGGPIPRSQDAPVEAFWDPEDAARHFEASEAMSTGVGQGDQGSFQPEMHCLGLFLYAISFCWIDQKHPDPKGFHLKRVATFLSGMATARKRMNSHEDIAVFIDYLSMPQEPRSSSENELFEDALTGMPVIYGHDLSLVLEMKTMPPCQHSLNGDGQYWSEDLKKNLAYDYADRGWPCFESTTAGSRSRVAGSRLQFFQDCSFTGSNGEHLEDWWGIMHKFGCQGVTYHPDDFEAYLRCRTFAKDGDYKIVASLYRKMFAVYRKTSAQHFSFVIWSAEHLERYAKALSDFDGLELFDMNQCQIRGDEGVVMICRELASKTTLHSLAFDRVSLTDAGVRALCHRGYLPPNLKFLSLGANSITDDAAQCMAEELPHKTAKLRDLRVSLNKITSVGRSTLLLSLPDTRVTF